MEKEYLIIGGAIVLLIGLLIIRACASGAVGYDDPYEIVPITYNPPAPEYVAFNLNDAIKVKLSGQGFKLLDKYNHDRLVYDMYFEELVSDKDGYCEFQAWEFMKIFGPHVFLGNDLFDANILIRSKDITVVKKSTF